MFLGGERRPSAAELTVHDPWTGDVVGLVARDGPDQVDEAVRLLAARRRSLAPAERAAVLSRAAAALQARAEELSTLITGESGVCRKETLREVERAAGNLRVAAVEAERIRGETIPVPGQRRLAITVPEPVGVVAGITPFNRPLNQVVVKVAPALAAGCPVVVKPSEKTPLTALALAELLVEAGCPPDALAVLTGEPGVVGPALAAHPGVDMVTFTGSVATGRAVAAAAAGKKLLLEMGGNDPLLVLPDANPDRAAPIAATGALAHASQSCRGVKRIVVWEEVADELVERLVAAARGRRFGDPRLPETDVGPLVSEEAARLVERRIAGAVAAGARLLLGGGRRGALVEPAVLDGVPPDVELVREETFGPVAPVIRVRDLDHAVEVVNGTRYGLQAGVVTRDSEAFWALAARLRVGAVNLDEGPQFDSPHIPFGGVKASGVGREGIRYSIAEMTVVKTITVPFGAPAPAQQPPQAGPPPPQAREADQRELLAKMLRERQARAREHPVSAQQEGLWFLEQLQPGDTAYNVSAARRYRGELDPAALERALAAVVRRHEALRTALAVAGGRPVQRVLPAVPVSLPARDLRHLGPAAAEEEAARRAARDLGEPFDLGRAPLFRGFLAHLAEREHLLVLTFHHVVFDGWSAGVLWRELDALSGGAALPELPVQYGDWARSQRDALSGERLERLLAWWRAHLDGAPPALRLPSARPRPAVPSPRSARHTSRLPEPLTERLADLAAGEGATPFMALLAGAAALLGGWSGQPDLVIGTPVANRGRPELEPLIGYFVNTLPLRVRLEPGESFRALLRRVREATVGAYGHQELPFTRLVETLRPERDPSRHPVFQVMLALQEPAPAGTGPDAWAAAAPPAAGSGKFDLTINAEPAGGGLRVTWEYLTDVLDEPAVAGAAARLTALLEAAVANPDAPAAEAPSRTEERVAAIWSEVLGVPVAGSRANFFDLGGVSLTATRAVARLRDAFRVELPLRELFLKPTVGELARALDEIGSAGARPP